MKVLLHPDFPRDQRRFQADYAEISAGRLCVDLYA